MSEFLGNNNPFYFEKDIKLLNGDILSLRNAITADAETVVNFFKVTSDESDNLSFSSDEYFVTPYEEKIVISNINRNSKTIMILGFIDEVLCCIAELNSSAELRLSHNVEIVISNINRNSKTIMILGFIDEVLCCIAELNSSAELRLSHNVEYSITVLKDFWGMGIGNAITNEIIEFAKEKNIKNIVLSVRRENSAAINLYKKYGFKTVGIKKDYICIDGKYDDEISMQLQL